jgi:hypothetical protein
MQREADLETGVAGCGVQLQVAMVAVDHHSPADVEPQPGALADWLGRKERFEDALGDLRRDTTTSVADLHQGELAVTGGAHGEGALPVHRIDCVVDQIGPHLVELSRVGRDGG